MQSAQRRHSRPAGKGNTRSSTAKKRSAPEPGRSFNFSYGVSLAMSNTKVEKLSDQYGQATITRGAAGFGLFVYPKYSFYNTDKYSISIGIPLTLAFSGHASTGGANGVAGSEFSFLYDLPLMIDYNGGVMAPAKRNSNSRIGYFGGVGVGIENTPANYAFESSSGYTGSYRADEDPKAKSVGPNFHAGIVFRLGSEYRPRYLGLRLSYKIGINKDKFNYFTPSVFLNI